MLHVNEIQLITFQESEIKKWDCEREAEREGEREGEGERERETDEIQIEQ